MKGRKSMDLLNKNYLSIKDVQELANVGYKSASEIVKPTNINKENLSCRVKLKTGACYCNI